MEKKVQSPQLKGEKRVSCGEKGSIATTQRRKESELFSKKFYCIISKKYCIGYPQNSSINLFPKLINGCSFCGSPPFPNKHTFLSSNFALKFYREKKTIWRWPA
ncbi:MAG: hypothetical protein Q8934_07805 [Bacillota bacterium]|nr:hypothetical protein [Bacillota bacterium]